MFGSTGAFAQQPPAASPATAGFDFSGVLFESYSYRLDSLGQAQTGGQHPNQFGIDRAYLTFRMPAGDNGAIRITTDVFQNTNSTQNAYYQGWATRIKYAYLKYTGLRDEVGSGSNLVGRLGRACAGDLVELVSALPGELLIALAISAKDCSFSRLAHGQ